MELRGGGLAEGGVVGVNGNLTMKKKESCMIPMGKRSADKDLFRIRGSTSSIKSFERLGTSYRISCLGRVPNRSDL